MEHMGIVQPQKYLNWTLSNGGPRLRWAENWVENSMAQGFFMADMEVSYVMGAPLWMDGLFHGESENPMDDLGVPLPICTMVLEYLPTFGWFLGQM